ncbi:MAG: hypothetical protein F7C35_01565 [Desulfurococcales archaeon]|nr:hypothetical protein [Desulfurococcales archaeon]
MACEEKLVCLLDAGGEGGVEILFGEPVCALGGLAADMMEAITQILSDGEELAHRMGYRAGWNPYSVKTFTGICTENLREAAHSGSAERLLDTALECHRYCSSKQAALMEVVGQRLGRRAAEVIAGYASGRSSGGRREAQEEELYYELVSGCPFEPWMPECALNFIVWSCRVVEELLEVLDALIHA